MLKSLVAYSVLFALVTTQAAWAAETARGGAQRSPAQEAQQAQEAAISAIDMDGQRTQLANAGKSLEALGIGFGTVPVAVGAASETTHISDLLSSGQSAFRVSVPARNGVAAYGIQVRSAAVAGGAIRVSVAAYDAAFSRRLGMQSMSFSPTEDSTRVRLRMEQVAQALAASVPRDGRHTSLLRKLYDAVVPSAEAGVASSIKYVIMFSVAMSYAFFVYAVDARGTSRIGFVLFGAVFAALALGSAYQMIQSSNEEQL